MNFILTSDFASASSQWGFWVPVLRFSCNNLFTCSKLLPALCTFLLRKLIFLSWDMSLEAEVTSIFLSSALFLDDIPSILTLAQLLFSDMLHTLLLSNEELSDISAIVLQLLKISPHVALGSDENLCLFFLETSRAIFGACFFVLAELLCFCLLGFSSLSPLSRIFLRAQSLTNFGGLLVAATFEDGLGLVRIKTSTSWLAFCKVSLCIMLTLGLLLAITKKSKKVFFL